MSVSVNASKWVLHPFPLSASALYKMLMLTLTLTVNEMLPSVNASVDANAHYE